MDPPPNRRTKMIRVYYDADHSMPTEPADLVWRGTSEREARRVAAKCLSVQTLRGLATAPTTGGVRYYGVGSSDTDGQSVEIVY
jgi:hypothetical protein